MIRQRDSITMCVNDCKYESVKRAARSLHWTLIDGDAAHTKANVLWVDSCNLENRFRELASWQRINNFPGITAITRKARMALALNRMQRQFPSDYKFYPRTFVLPAEWSAFRGEFDAYGRSSRTYIVKPDAGSQGRGIHLTKTLDDVSPLENQVAQLYVPNPLLVEGFKFDIRIYVLITSIRPLHVYMYKDGLVRLCTEPYKQPSAENLSDHLMHLTNYSINKVSERFVANEHRDNDGEGSKRSLRWLLSWIEDRYGKDKAESIQESIGSSVMKTITAVLPQLHRAYRGVFGEAVYSSHAPANSVKSQFVTSFPDVNNGSSHQGVQDEEHTFSPTIEGSRCIEILVFDFMIDTNLKTWLIELNNLPSFATDSPLDESIKGGVITTALSVLRAKVTDHQSYVSAARRDAQARLYPKPRTFNMPSSEPTKKGGRHRQNTGYEPHSIRPVYQVYIGEKTRLQNKQYNNIVRKRKGKIRRERGSRASCDTLGGRAVSEEKQPVWKEESELDVLDWETFQLEGWNRLWPHVENEQMAIVEGRGGQGPENLSEVAASRKMKYKKLLIDMFSYAVEEDHKQFLRLNAPLHQNRGVINNSETQLPAIRKRHSTPPNAYAGLRAWCQNSYGNGNRGMMMGKPPPKLERFPLYVPSIEQRTTATRLSSGYSSKSYSFRDSAEPLTAAVEAASNQVREWKQQLDATREKRVKRPSLSVSLQLIEFLSI